MTLTLGALSFLDNYSIALPVIPVVFSVSTPTQSISEGQNQVHHISFTGPSPLTSAYAFNIIHIGSEATTGYTNSVATDLANAVAAHNTAAGAAVVSYDHPTTTITFDIGFVGPLVITRPTVTDGTVEGSKTGNTWQISNLGGNTYEISIDSSPVTILDVSGSVNDYVPSTAYPGVAWQVPHFDYPIGRLSTNPLRHPSTVPGIVMGTNFCTIRQLGYYADIDFRGFQVRIDLLSGANTDPLVLLMDQCLFNFVGSQAVGPGQSPVMQMSTTVRADFAVHNSTVFGPKDTTTTGNYTFQTRISCIDIYRVFQDGGAQDFSSSAGGIVEECCVLDTGYAKGGHVDGVRYVGTSQQIRVFNESHRAVDDFEHRRCAQDVSISLAAVATNTGNTATDALTNSTTKQDKDFGPVRNCLSEENIIWGKQGTFTDPFNPNPFYRFTHGHGDAGPENYSRYIRHHVRDFRSGNVISPSLALSASVQFCKRLDTGAAIVDNRVGARTDWPDKQTVTLSSPSAGVVIPTFTPSARADFVEYQFRRLGTARWGRWRRITSGTQITGLVNDGVPYEFKFRAFNRAGVQSEFPDKLQFRPNGVGGGGTDSTPNQFSFAQQSSVPLNSTRTSSRVTINGINTTVMATVTGPGLYSHNSGSFTPAGSFSVQNNDTIDLQVTTNGVPSAEFATTLNVGGVSATWTVTNTASAYDSDASALFTRLDATGTAVDTAHKDAINSAIVRMKTGAGAALWASCLECITGCLQTEAHSLTNWKDNGIVPTATAGVGHTANDGFTRAATTDSVGSGFDTFTEATAWAPGTSTVIFGARVTSLTSAPHIGGSSRVLVQFKTDGTLASRLNTTSSLSGAVPLVHAVANVTTWVALAANDTASYRVQSLAGEETVTRATAAPTAADEILLMRSGPSAGHVATVGAGLMIFDRNLTNAEIAEAIDIMVDLRTSVGAPA